MLDSLGSAASFFSTLFFIQLNRLAWPMSLVAICLNGYLYWQKGIFADTVLEGLYFITTCYGWFLWSKHRQLSVPSSIHKLSLQAWLVLACCIVLLFISIKFLLTHYTNSTVANLDALTTAMSIAAQWLMCYKIIATWVLWFITDAIYAYLYWHKQLPFHTLLMTIYTGLAILGFLRWRKLTIGKYL